MSKASTLALLGSVDLQDAGVAFSYVQSLPEDDPRFGTAPKGANSAIGYWLREEKTTKGTTLLSICRPARMLVFP